MLLILCVCDAHPIPGLKAAYLSRGTVSEIRFGEEGMKAFAKEVQCCWCRLILDLRVHSGMGCCFRYADPRAVWEN